MVNILKHTYYRLKFHILMSKNKLLLIAIVSLNSFIIASILDVLTPLSISSWYAILLNISFAILYLLECKPDTDPEYIISICAYCGKIKDINIYGEKSWIDAEEFICGSSESLLSHGICKDCYKKQMEEFNHIR